MYGRVATNYGEWDWRNVKQPRRSHGARQCEEAEEQLETSRPSLCPRR